MALTAAQLRALFEVDDSAAQATLDAFPGSVAKMAGAVAAAGVVVGGALAAGLAQAMDVESANAKLEAQLGLTAAESARYGTLAGEVYAQNYGDSLETVNGAIGAVLSSISGMRQASDAEVEAMAKAALNLASTFEVDVTRAAQVAGQMITSGLAADGTQAMDLLSAAMQRVPAAVRQDILDAVDEYGPFMSSLGLQGEAAFGLLVQSAEKGMYGIDKTGDSLKEFTIRATDMSSASKVGFDLLGMSQEDMSGKLLAGGDTAAAAFKQIVDGLVGIKDPTAQSQAALALFGTPLEDLSVSEIPKFLGSLQQGEDAMAGFAGSADQIDSALGGTASAALSSFKRQAQQAFVDMVGGQLLPAATTAAQYLQTNFGPALTETGRVMTEDVLPAGQAVIGWLQQNQTWLGVVAAVIAAVFIPHFVALGVTATVQAAKTAVAWAITSAGAVGAAAVHSVQVVRMVAGWVLVGAQSMIQAARVAAAWLIAMGPVGLVIAIVIGLVALIIANWDTIKKWTGAAWDWVVDKTTAAWDWIKAQIAEKVAAIVGIALRIAAFRDRVVATFEQLRAQAIAKALALVTWVRGLPGRLLDSLGNLAGSLVSKGRDLVQGLWDGIRGMGSWLADKVGGFVADFIPGPIAKALGISSPSKVAAALAREVPRGLVVGIDAGAPDVRAASARMAAAVISAPLTVPAPAFGLSAPPMPAGVPTFQRGDSSLFGQVTAPAPAGGREGPLLNVEKVELIRGEPDEVAERLHFKATARGGI